MCQLSHQHWYVQLWMFKERIAIFHLKGLKQFVSTSVKSHKKVSSILQILCGEGETQGSLVSCGRGHSESQLCCNAPLLQYSNLLLKLCWVPTCCPELPLLSRGLVPSILLWRAPQIQSGKFILLFILRNMGKKTTKKTKVQNSKLKYTAGRYGADAQPMLLNR